MEIVGLRPLENPTTEALLAFLEQCRALARRDAHPKLASITVTVEALDPLAVLESIFDPSERHFYAERPKWETAIAGADAVVMRTAQGPSRFDAVQDFVDEIVQHTVAVGDVHSAFGGPHFFTSFAFEDEAAPDQPFPAAHAFVPRWQVARAGGQSTAVANVWVEEHTDLLAAAQRVMRAHRKFAAFDYTGMPVPSDASPRVRPTPGRIQSRETGDYRDLVRRGLQRIGSGKVEKIVLARALELIAEHPLHPLELLNTLREKFPDCYSFSVGNGSGSSFIGASPERLVRVSQQMLLTEALAGSIRRGQGASEDAALAAALLASEKDQREHRLVIESIRRRLGPLGLNLRHPEKPELRRLANVQHLFTPIETEVPKGFRTLQAVAALHPTPAVGGTPRIEALAGIAELETAPRGLYAGALGWVNARGGGEFFVGLRSAFISGARALAWAGAGIVAGSDPDRELAETDLKFRAFLDVLNGR